MKSIGALWYLDSHRARNALRAIVRSPLRLVVWGVIGLWLALQVFQRVALPRHVFLFHDLADPVASLIAGLVLVLYGITLARPSGFGRVTAFGDPIDAMFLARSAIDERLAVFWLQLRQLLLNSWRIAFAAVFVGLYFSRANPVGAIAGLAGVLILLELLSLPTVIIARRTVAITYVWYAMAGLGTMLFIGALLVPASIGMLGLGRAVIAIWHGDPAALAILYGCIAAAVLAGTVCANDVYPEFYAAARTTETARARLRRGDVLRLPASGKATRSGSTVLRGPWVEIWKQLAFVRRGNGLIVLTAGALIALVLGITGGELSAQSKGAAPFSIGLTALVVVLVMQTTRSVSLAQDISKPLWWMGDGSTFSKLAIWTLASSLPALAFVALVTATMLAIIDPARLALYVLLVSAVVVVSRAVGVLGYALTPALIDQRGPGMVIRLLILYASAIAPTAAGVVAGLAARSVDTGLLCGALTFLGEGALCILFAVLRLNGRGMEIALAEAA